MTHLPHRIPCVKSRARRPVLAAFWLVWLIASCTSPPADDGDGGSDDVDVDGGDTGVVMDHGEGDDEDGDETALCEAACDFETTCIPEYPYSNCVADCLSNLEVFDGDEPCDAAMAIRYACEPGYESCEPTEIPDECAAALATMHECELKYGCLLEFGKSLDDVSCTATETCNPLDPHVREMSCDETTCVCTDGGQVTGQCDAQGFCPSIEPFDPSGETLVVEFVEACCGWPEFGEAKDPNGG